MSSSSKVKARLATLVVLSLVAGCDSGAKRVDDVSRGSGDTQSGSGAQLTPLLRPNQAIMITPTPLTPSMHDGALAPGVGGGASRSITDAVARAIILAGPRVAVDRWFVFRLTPDAIGTDGTFSVAKDTLEECFFTDAGGMFPCSADKAVEALISDVSGKSLSSQRYSYFAITPAESASLLSGKHVRIRVWSNSRGSSAMLRLLVMSRDSASADWTVEIQE